MTRLASIAVASLALCGAAAVRAETVCIACAGPDTRYACSTTATGASAGLACAEQLAQRGRHASCAVSRSQPCNGVAVALDAPKDDIALSAESEAQLPANSAQLPSDSAQLTPPNAAERAFDAARDGARRAWDATGDAARAAGDCALSRFTRC